MLTGYINLDGKFVNITITELRKPDDKGNTHTIYLTQNKEERAAKTPKTYIGKAKEIKFNNNDDLPI